MNSVDKCLICEQEFYVEKMTDGKCDVCHARFPGIKDRAELLKQKEEKQNEKYNDGNFDNMVTKKVTEVLKNYNVLVECGCGGFYYRRSPAQKTCGNCGDKKDE